MRRYRMWRALSTILTICMLLTTLSGCALAFGEAHIKGKVYGNRLLDELSSPTTPVALAATVRCNGTSVIASADGSYDLKLPASDQYHCDVSAPPNYVPQTVILRGDGGASLTLDFGPTNLVFPCAQTGATVECAVLRLKTGIITGKVTYQGASATAPGTRVQCASASGLAATAPLAIDSSSWPSTNANPDGTFTIASIEPGLHDCFATAPNGDMQRARTLVVPAKTTSLNFSVCGTRCNLIHYHGGPVMHTYTAYLIFWLPKPYVFDPSGDDARFMSSIAQYFKDIGGTSFYGLLTQYWDYQGAIQNSARLGDVYLDTTPYQRCDYSQTSCSHIAATPQQPLLDTDIRGEVERAVHAHPSWHTDLTSEFFVFTGYNAEECESGDTHTNCTFTTDPQHSYCGYHDNFTDDYPDSTLTTPLIYSYMPDAANHCLWKNGYIGPHNDNLIDAEINTISHEQFESVTDPLPHRDKTLAWYQDNLDREGEIGDKCVGDYGTIQPDGSDVTLAHGNTYILQSEWSNRANRCSFT